MANSQYFKDQKTYKGYLDELDKAWEDGDFEKVKQLVLALDLRHLRRIETPLSVLIPDVITAETYINCIMIAILGGHLDIVRFFLEDCRIDVHDAVKLSNTRDSTSRAKSVENEAFCLFLCISEGHQDIFNYIYLNHSYIFDKEHLKAWIKLWEALDREKFIDTLINSKTSHEIFNSQELDGKIEMINFLLSDDRKYK